MKLEEIKTEEYLQRVQEQLRQLQEKQMEEQEDEETRKEKARQRRLAILQKHKEQQAGQTLPPQTQSTNEPAKEQPKDAPDTQPTQSESPVNSDVNNNNNNVVLVTTPSSSDESATGIDDFDMFDTRKSEPLSPTQDVAAAVPVATEIEADSEGYCLIRLGEVLNQRYKVVSHCGRGVFSRVVKCLDLETNQMVAIKVVRDNDMMKRVGQKEIETLQLVARNDPENKYNCIKLITHFVDRDFLCLVFEPMLGSLREVIRKYGKSVGLSLTAVQLYAKKLFFALHYIKRLGIVHTDIKPDNLLVNDAKTGLKVADFGSSMDISEMAKQTFAELQTGFYRAPEVLLGLSDLSYEIDMWSAACAIYEMATGKLLFPLSQFTTSELVKCQMELKGSFPKKMLKKGAWRTKFFDDNFHFLQHKPDSLTGKDFVVPTVMPQQPTRDLLAELMCGLTTAAEKKRATELHDLLQKCLHLDPSKRLTPEEALRHPFFQN
jgi:serine/threonine-protein kinase PRP4